LIAQLDFKLRPCQPGDALGFRYKKFATLPGFSVGCAFGSERLLGKQELQFVDQLQLLAESLERED